MNRRFIETIISKDVCVNDTDTYKKFLDEFDRQLLEQTMLLCKFNQSKVARVLGLSRGTVRNKLKDLFDDKYL